MREVLIELLTRYHQMATRISTEMSPLGAQLETPFHGTTTTAVKPSVEHSLKVATQMARDHARLGPDVDPYLTYYIIYPIQLTRPS